MRAASSRRTGAAWRIAGWCACANRKPKPSSSIDRSIRSGASSRSNPSASSTSAAPVAEDAARLPCFATPAPAAAATSAAAVEMLNVFAPSPPGAGGVDEIVAGAGSASTCSRIASAQPAISSAVSPFGRSATRKPPIWAGVASPRMIVFIASRASSRERSRPSSSCASACWITGALAKKVASRVRAVGRRTDSGGTGRRRPQLAVPLPPSPRRPRR